VLPRPLPIAAPGSLVLRPGLEAPEVSEVGIGNEDDIAAAPAVATVRASLRDVLLATEAKCAVPAAAGLDTDLGVIVEQPLYA
jgi:hypothetical protein